MDEPVHVRAGRLRPWAAAGCRAPATTAAVRWCPTGWTAVLDRWETVEGAVKGAVWVSVFRFWGAKELLRIYLTTLKWCLMLF